jgi:sugar lactone lactonase YvrE
MRDSAKRVVVAVLSAALLLGACGGSETPAPAARSVSGDEPIATLYWLDIWEGSVYRATGPDFDDDERLVHPTDTAPDGIAVDVTGGKLYWTNMGDFDGFGGGTLQRAGLDGTDVARILEPGVTHTPKQLQLDHVHGHLYWCDRTTAQVWRSGLDGGSPEVVVAGHGLQQPVGVALDVPTGKLYFGDRAARKIFRVGIDLPPGRTAADRPDVELLHAFPDGAMPIDLAVDPDDRHLYWTDRALGTVNRSSLDLPAGQDPATRTDVETLATDLHQPIGIALDVANDKLYFAQHGDPLASIPGTVTEAALDGTGAREIARGNVITGVTLVHVPAS